MITKQCPICGKPFQTSNLQKLTCCYMCARRHEALTRGDIGICLICGKKFFQVKIRNEKQRTCSLVCGAKLRFLNETQEQKKQRSSKLPPILMNCATCGKQFENTNRIHTRQFCSRACSSKSRAGINKGWIPGPEWREKASKRMKQSNPMVDPENREKASAKLRGETFSGIRGGNGQLTPQQTALATALGWEMEVAISSGNPKWPVLVVDIGNLELKIAIEVDGGSHHATKQKNRDRMKTEMLNAIDWFLIRFWNLEVDNDLEKCVSSVLNLCQARKNMFTTWK